MTLDDLVRFWSRLPNGAYVHPDDEEALRHNPHKLRIDHLPVPWSGPLLSADVYLLYLNHGVEESSEWEQVQRDHEDVLRMNLNGRTRNYLYTPGYRDGDDGAQWLLSRLNGVALEEEIATRCAVLEIVAYRSRQFEDDHMVGALASSRAMLATVHEDLLPKARRGKIMIACMRSARKWGFHRKIAMPGILMGRGRGGYATIGTEVGRAIQRFLER